MHQTKRLLTSLALAVALLLGTFQISVLSVANAASPATTSNQDNIERLPVSPGRLTPQTSVTVPGQEIGPSNSQQLLQMAVTLRPSDPAALDQFLQDLYDPTSSLFHQYLTPQEYTSRFYDKTSRTQVISYLQSKGFTVQDSGIGTVINFTGTVAQAQQAFNVTISDYKASDGRVFYSNKQTPAIPATVAATTFGLVGLDNSVQVQPMYRRQDLSKSNAAESSKAVQPKSASGCSSAVSVATNYGSYNPNQLKTAYGFDSLLSASITGAGQKIALFELDDYRDANVTAYQNCFGTNVSVSRVAVNGGVSTYGNGESEVELDIDVVVGMAPGLSQVLVYEAGNSSTNSLAEYQKIANDNQAKIVSSSWGLCEGFASYNSAYINFFNSENTVFQQMAAQGQSTYVAAGDDGSEGCLWATSSLPTSYQTALSAPAEAAFPYAISVGGTKLTLNSTNNTISSEVTWNDYSQQYGAGGGGVSTLWSKPSWQTGPGTTNSYSNGKRQVPDISADASPNSAYTVYVHDTNTFNGHTYCYYYSGVDGSTDCFEPVGGTSAATPLWAAATALLNQYSLSKGQTVFGFGNPALYRLLSSTRAYSIFRDITSGDNCYYSATCGTPNSGTATYPATANYDQATGIGSLNAYQLALAVTQASTTTITSAPNPSTYGQSVTFTATVSPVSGTDAVTGYVTFQDGGSTLVTKTLTSGVATYTTSSLAAGTHTINAVYSGDALFLTSSRSMSQVVNQASTMTSLTSAPNPSTYKQSVTFTATVTSSAGTPSGSVDFKEGATLLGSGTLNANGVATFSTSSLSVGSHTITGYYNGASNYATSNGATSQTVNKASSSTALTSAPNPSIVNQSVTFTATVTSSVGTPTGSVSFQENGSTIGSGTLNANGVATFSTSGLSAGTHTITALYNGDTNFNTSSGSTNQVVNQIATTTSLTSAPNPSTFNQNVTFTATVTSANGTPSGSVTFQESGVTLGSSNLDANGNALFITSTLSAGTHHITANYNGSSVYLTSSGSTDQVVNKSSTATTLTSAPSLSTYGQSVTFTATVTSAAGTPTGSVDFKEGTTLLGSGTLNANGVATFSTSSLAFGLHYITAYYNGATNFATSNGSTAQTVNKANSSTALTSAPNPSTYGQSVIFTATVASSAGIPTGSVSFQENGSTIGSGTLNANGVATFSTSSLSAGTHTITAVYNGDTNYNTSSGNTNQVVNAASTTTSVTSAPNPSTYGQSVTFTITVTSAAGTPTGTVNLALGPILIYNVALDANGVAIVSSNLLPVATNTITANYTGATNFATSSGTSSQTVNKADSSTALTSAPNPSMFNQNVTFTATVTSSVGTPTGSVDFKEGSTTLGSGSLDANGVATFSTTTLSVGTHTITAVYNGDFSYNGSQASTDQVVNQGQSSTTTTLTSAPNPSTYGQNVTFTATVTSASGTPTGTVTFRDNNLLLGSGTLNANGVATFSTSSLAVGSHAITANYNGAGIYTASSGNTSQTVNKADSSTALTSAPNPSIFNQNVTFTATVTSAAGTPTGPVDFKEGSTTLGSGNLDANGVATFSISTLSVGTHHVTAVYNGDTNFNTSNGSTDQVVNQGQTATTTSVTSAPNPSTYKQSVTFTATVTSAGGTPTGSVDFKEGSTTLGSGTLNANGVATFSTNSLAVGSHTITANYNGAGVYTASSGSTSQVVNKANTTTTLTSAPNPASFGQNVTITATVTSAGGIPTGKVDFSIPGAGGGSSGLDANGVATFSTNSLPAGTYTITATYNGDANFNSSQGSTTQVVNSVGCANALTVSVATDDGTGLCNTLSGALLQAQSSATPVTITLATSVITMTGPMPLITPTVAVSIKGTCNAGPANRIVAGTGAGSSALTLTSNMKLSGVAITGFSGYALNITGNNNSVDCTWLGTADGTTAAANGGGIHLYGSNNNLGGSSGVNLISGNTNYGILVEAGSLGNQLSNTWIGLKSDGTTTLANGKAALKINAGGQLKLLTGNRIRG